MSSSKQDHTYLQFSVKALALVNLWPQECKSSHRFVKQYYITFVIIVTTFPILADMISQFYEDNVSLTSLNENIVALSALYGVIYVSICFITTNKNIKKLVEELAIFEKYCPMLLIEKAEMSAKFYTKLFIIYGIVGNIFYGLIPFVTYKECSENRTDHMLTYGIPCGLVIRFLLPFKIDYSPFAEFFIFEELAVCTLSSTIIIMVTMLICGILIHITTQLRYLKSLILDLSSISDEENLLKKIRFCVKFHIVIINYAKRADSSFSKMMLLHITWTGFIISVLGFEITATSNVVEGFRFFMHLTGWLGMLFLICYYGQTLMDESLEISKATYSFKWYEKSIKIQKHTLLMLVRSQKALTLKAAGLNVMSLTTFIGVLYSAYSYFTLLLKLKQ